MNGFVNRVSLIGNVGRDAELFTTPSGTKMAKLHLATKERIRKDGLIGIVLLLTFR